MSLGAGDISWQTLRRIVCKWQGTAAELDEVAPLSGGCINTTLAIKLKDGQKAVLKVSPHRIDRSFVTEAHQLNALRDRGLPTPGVLDVHLANLDEPDSYLLLQHMPGIPLDEARQQLPAEDYADIQKHLAELVLAMHESTSGAYQRVTPDSAHPADASSQILQQAKSDAAGCVFTSWTAFFHHLYDPIYHHVEHDQHLPTKSRRLIHKIHDHVEQLVDHADKPRLTHGDLWAHNVLVDKHPESGKWHVSAVLDPNAKFSHAEHELAYLELFGTVTADFINTYRQSMPLNTHYVQVRKPVYQLYSMMNHLRLFGAPYATRVQKQAEAVAKLM